MAEENTSNGTFQVWIDWYQRMLDRLWEIDIWILSTVPIVLSLIIMVGWVLYTEIALFDESHLTELVYLPFVFAGFVGGFSGIAQVWKRETPNFLFRQSGSRAVISGTLLVAFYWGFSLVMMAAIMVNQLQ